MLQPSKVSSNFGEKGNKYPIYLSQFWWVSFVSPIFTWESIGEEFLLDWKLKLTNQRKEFLSVYQGDPMSLEEFL